MNASNLFTPSEHFSSQINGNVIQSEVEGGVFLDTLPPGTVLDVETKHHTYRLENRGEGKAMLQGHPTYCPEPVLVDVHGSTWRHSMLKVHYLGRGMYLEFFHPEFGIVTTSKILDIREVPPPVASKPS